MSNIQDFISLINKRGGLARPNRFKVYMNPPVSEISDISETNNVNTGGRGDDTSTFTVIRNSKTQEAPGKDISMLASSVTLPGRSLMTTDYSLHKQQQKLPVGFTNEDVSMVFHVTNDLFIRTVFEKWIEATVHHFEYRVAYHNEYARTVAIEQLDSEDNIIHKVTLLNAYPILIGPTAIDNSSTNETQKLEVTFTYEDYYNDFPSDSSNYTW